MELYRHVSRYLRILVLLGSLGLLKDGFTGLGVATGFATAPCFQPPHVLQPTRTNAKKAIVDPRYSMPRFDSRPGAAPARTLVIGGGPTVTPMTAALASVLPLRRQRSGRTMTTAAIVQERGATPPRRFMSRILRFERRCSTSGTSRGGDVGDGLKAFFGGSGPPRSGSFRKWGWGGDDGGEGKGESGNEEEGRGGLVALGAAQMMMSRRHGWRRPSFGQRILGRGRSPSNGNGTPMFTSTKVLTALNVAVFFLQMRFPSITKAGWKLAPAIIQRGQWYRLITPVVLHGSLAHLLINSLSFNSVGPIVERVLGVKKFLTVYALAGISGNALSCIVNPSTPAVGASGAIFGMVGAWGAFCLMNESFLGRENSQRALKSVGQTVMINVVYGMSSSQIDNMGHLGGFLGGAAVTFLIGPRLKRRMNPFTGEQYTVDESSQLEVPGFRKRARGSSRERRWP